ncbi:MAG: tetratricopeptide repeat protein [Symploca sp. SIO3E6]|nr:tetratricopeptide repeat protein [Caldora sp. SIO3E6]
MSVMREPVVDQVAQEFLKYFLKSFAFKEPFHLAVRQTREQLKGMESYYPGASWLPVICQHPAVMPPTLSSPPTPTPRRKWLVFAAMFLVGCLSSYWLAGPQFATFANQLGSKNHSNGELLLAKQYYHLATFLNWEYAQPHYNLGWLCDESFDDIDCSIQAYQSAALRGLPEAFAELARLHIKENNIEAALKAIWECLERTNDDAVKAACLKNRGWIRWQQKRFDEAEQELRQAIALEHDSPHAHCLLAQVLEAQGKEQEAILAWKNTIKYSESQFHEQDQCISMAKQRLSNK